VVIKNRYGKISCFIQYNQLIYKIIQDILLPLSCNIRVKQLLGADAQNFFQYRFYFFFFRTSFFSNNRIPHKRILHSYIFVAGNNEPKGTLFYFPIRNFGYISKNSPEPTDQKYKKLL